MVNSAKPAKRKRLAQEAQQRETSRSSHQMDPVDLSEHGTDLEEEDDHEILFPSRTRNTVEPPPSPARVQATTDCEIINMVKTLNGGSIRHLPRYSPDTAGIPTVVHGECGQRQGTS